MRTQKGKKDSMDKDREREQEVFSVSYSNSPGPQVQLSHSVFPLFLVPHGMAKQEERL